MTIRNLSYVGFVSPAAEAWRSFGPEILGAELAADGPNAAVRLRVDDAAWRITIHPGEANDLAYLGWNVGEATALDAAVARLEKEGIEVNRGDAGVAELRAVDAIAWFADPFGFRHELTHGLKKGAPFTPGRKMSGFVTGEQGLGHVVLIVPDLQAGQRFYTDVLGLKLSDCIDDSGLSLRFFHCAGRAARHHTIAMASAHGMVGVHHLMLEVRTLDDVGTALDLINDRQIALAMTLGRHTNDLMTSFYVRTPSGFEIEYGTGGKIVDDASWQVAAYDAGSLWGHKPPSTGPLFPNILRPTQPTGASTA